MPGISVSKICIPFGSGDALVTMSAGEVSIRAGNTIAWYDFTDATTLTDDGGGRISLWKDKLLSGHDLVAGSEAARPTLGAAGLTFDGIDNHLETAAIAELDQPTFIYLVLKQITWAHGKQIFDGITADIGTIYQYTSTPSIMAYAGGAIVLDGNLALDTFAIVRVLFNGALSKLIINNSAPTTGNFGATNMGGIALAGAGGGTGANKSNIQIKEGIFRNVADDAATESAIYAYLKAKHGL